MGLQPGEPPYFSLRPAAFSPDGRLFLAARPDRRPGSLNPAPAGTPAVYTDPAWTLSVLKPEAVQIGVNGLPSGGSNGPDLGSGAWSTAVPLEPELPLPVAGQGLPDTQYFKRAVALCPAPSKSPCPYPSSSSGQVVPPPASFETYSMLVFAEDYWDHVDSSGSSLTQPTFTTAGAPNARNVHVIGMRRLVATVSSPRTSQAAVSGASLTPFQVLQWSEVIQGQPQTGPVLGIEPTISLDGRLLVFHSNASNFTSTSGTVPVWYTINSRNDHIMYSFNPTPGQVTGWSKPRPINQLCTGPHANLVVDGVPFRRRYPIAARPLLQGDGTPLTGNLEGAYPWMTLDATDIVLVACRNDDDPSLTRHGCVSLIGRSTGYVMRHIDGPLNRTRNGVDFSRTFTTGTGLSPGIWRWGGSPAGSKLPYTAQQATIPIFLLVWRDYAEISVHEYYDQDYLVAWDMNELLREDPPAPLGTGCGWRLDLTRTADLSGNNVTGTLSAGASFSQDSSFNPIVSGTYRNAHGRVGDSVHFTTSGQLTAPGAGVLATTLPALTVACWVENHPSGSNSSTLLDKPGSYRLEVAANGDVRATIVTPAGTSQSNWNGAPANGGWHHYAMTFDGSTLIAYVDGAQVDAVTVAAGGVVAASSSPLSMGPAGSGWMAVDTVRISRVARTPAEIQRDAFRAPAASTLQPLPPGSFTLPTGLRAEETLVPVANPLTRAKIDLGEVLFHDPDLSRSTTRSCGTCHSPAPSFSFTDHLAQRPRLANPGFLRNAQPTINRLFSSVQFWDGRAASLEAQAPQPIESVDEMASSSSLVLLRIGASTTQNYRSLFTSAFPSLPWPPSYPQGWEAVKDAISSYERAIVAGNSPADRYEAGSGSLSPSELAGHDLFFGKARCFGCHNGCNFSDERFHVSVGVDASATDTGRESITGRSRDTFRFKTPTLRNLRDTGPYFHDGSVTSLRKVVEAYNQGGRHPRFVDEEIFPLGLADQEVDALVDYLLALSGGWAKL